MRIPEHYSLVKDHPQSYEIHDGRDNSRFHIAKAGLNLGTLANLAQIQKYSEGTPDKPVQASDAIPIKDAVAAADADNILAPAEGMSPLAQGSSVPDQDTSIPNPSPTMSGQNIVLDGDNTTPDPKTQAASNQSLIPNPSAQTQDFQALQSQIDKQQAAQSVAGTKTATSFETAAEGLQDDFAQIQKDHDDLNTKDAEFQAKIQNVDPQRYWSNQGIASNVLSAIGLLFGGLSAGSNGGVNPVQQYISKAIDNDIEAQKANQSKDMNLWKMNRENYQTDLQTRLAMRNQLLSVADAQAKAYAAAAGNPDAQLKYAQMKMQIGQEINQNNRMQAIMGIQQQGKPVDIDPAQLVPSMVHNPEQQKQVYEEIGRAQNVARNKEEILKTFDQAVADTTAMKTLGGLRTPGSLLKLHQLLLPNFKQVDGTVRQAAMDETFHNIDPAQFDGSDKTANKRAALQNWMESETAAPVAKGNGLDLQKFRSTSARTGNYQPGQVVSVKGQNYKVGSDGDSLIPIK